MSEYGYHIDTSVEERDEKAKKIISSLLPSALITFEQRLPLGKKRRPAFEKLLEKLKPGDTLYIYSMDMLGLSVSDIIHLWKSISQDRRTNLVILDTTWLDTRVNPNIPVAYIKLAAETAFAELLRAKEKHEKIYTAISFADAALCEVS